MQINPIMIDEAYQSLFLYRVFDDQNDTDQNNSEYGHFSRSVIVILKKVRISCFLFITLFKIPSSIQYFKDSQLLFK